MKKIYMTLDYVKETLSLSAGFPRPPAEKVKYKPIKQNIRYHIFLLSLDNVIGIETTRGKF